MVKVTVAKVMVKVTMTFSTKKLIIRQCLRPEPLNLDGMLVLTLMAKVKVTVTASTKQAHSSAMLRARTLKGSRDVSSDQKMTLRSKVMVMVTMTFRTASLLAMLCITSFR